jgi:hypothetical protein
VLAERLGHSKGSMSLDVYSHTSEEALGLALAVSGDDAKSAVLRIFQRDRLL